MNPKFSSLSLQWEVESTVEAVEKIGRELLDRVRERDFPEEDQFAIHLALEEALVNAVRHGNGGDAAKKVFVDCTVTEEKFDITITDQGPGFDPSTIPDPRCPENLYKCSGRGVLLIFAYMDLVEFNDRGNSLHMIKYRDRGKPQEVSSRCGSL